MKIRGERLAENVLIYGINKLAKRRALTSFIADFLESKSWNPLTEINGDIINTDILILNY